MLLLRVTITRWISYIVLPLVLSLAGLDASSCRPDDHGQDIYDGGPQGTDRVPSVRHSARTRRTLSAAGRSAGATDDANSGNVDHLGASVFELNVTFLELLERHAGDLASRGGGGWRAQYGVLSPLQSAQGVGRTSIAAGVQWIGEHIGEGVVKSAVERLREWREGGFYLGLQQRVGHGGGSTRSARDGGG